MSSQPCGEFSFTDAVRRHTEHDLNDVGFWRFQPPAVQLEEDRHRKKGNSLVPVAVGVARCQSPSVGRCQPRKVALRLVVPALLGTRDGGFERVLVPNPGQAAVLPQLVEMNRVENDALYPRGFPTAAGHELLRQLAQGVSVLLGDPSCNRQGSLNLGIVGRNQDSLLAFHGQHAISGLQV